ncbi:hypothetical protein LCGC14_2908660, partial [marine sediment metagenome]
MSTTEKDLERLEGDSPFAFLPSFSSTSQEAKVEAEDDDSPFVGLPDFKDPGVITPKPIDPALGRFLRGGVK